MLMHSLNSIVIEKNKGTRNKCQKHFPRNLRSMIKHYNTIHLHSLLNLKQTMIPHVSMNRSYAWPSSLTTPNPTTTQKTMDSLPKYETKSKQDTGSPNARHYHLRCCDLLSCHMCIQVSGWGKGNVSMI